MILPFGSMVCSRKYTVTLLAAAGTISVLTSLSGASLLFFFEWLIAERQVWILGTATEGCTESWLSCGGSWGNPFGVQLYPSLPNRGEHSGRGWKWVHFSLGRGLQLGDSQPFTRDCGSGTEPPLHATTLPVPVKVKDIGKSKYDMLLATVHVQESGPGRTGVIFLRATSTLGRGGPPFK
mmetsp:Transcript_91566/g.158757  ORF Transcript_91566/g.158757 Transcript_91566/m.158757 type:complete len:180 (+) Transcript_91566:2310-2849(+)